MSDPASPGWDAINAALQPIYGKTEPLHMGTAIPYALGGPDPIQGISAYTRPDHWHFVTFGFTELYEKESADPKISGYGFELTLRLARKPSDEKPPNWAFGFLQNLGRYVFSTGNVFASGDHMPLNGPIAQGSPTLIHSAAFGKDPELGPFESKNGSADFIQVVGITNEELELLREWNTERFLEEFRKENPLLVTDLDRTSRVTARLRQLADREGSSMGMTFFEGGRFIDGSPFVLEIGALYVPPLLQGLKGRTLHDREFTMAGQEQQIKIVGAKHSGFKATGTELTVEMTGDLTREVLGTLKPLRGDYQWKGLPGFVIRVVPTPIKDQNDKVVETLG